MNDPCGEVTVDLLVFKHVFASLERISDVCLILNLPSDGTPHGVVIEAQV
jgi:hypothetical protein